MINTKLTLDKWKLLADEEGTCFGPAGPILIKYQIDGMGVGMCVT